MMKRLKGKKGTDGTERKTKVSIGKMEITKRVFAILKYFFQK